MILEIYHDESLHLIRYVIKLWRSFLRSKTLAQLFSHMHILLYLMLLIKRIFVGKNTSFIAENYDMNISVINTKFLLFFGQVTPNFLGMSYVQWVWIMDYTCDGLGQKPI